MELPAHEVLQSLQTLLSSSQIAVPSSCNVTTQPKNMSSAGAPSAHSEGSHASAGTPPEADGAGTNGPPTPTRSERLEADFRRGNHYLTFHFRTFISFFIAKVNLEYVTV